jgi:hypothetical protein
VSEGKLPAISAGANPLAIVPSTMDEVSRIAKMVFNGGMAPASFKNAEAVGTAIMMGLELGIKPMLAINKIAVIKGRPAIWGDLVPALIFASGVVEEFKEWHEGEGDTRTAHCLIKRKGFDPVERTFSVADAKQAGLWDQRPIVDKWERGQKVGTKQNDSPWFRFPDRMLQMRARGFCSRDAVPDVLSGLYLAEELDPWDNARDITEQVREEPPEPPPPPESAGEPPAPPEPPEAPSHEPVTAETAQKFFDDLRADLLATDNLEEIEAIFSSRVQPNESELEALGWMDDIVRMLRVRRAELEP